MRILGLSLALAAFPTAAQAAILLPAIGFSDLPILAPPLPPVEEVGTVGSLSPLDLTGVFLAAPAAEQSNALPSLRLSGTNPARVLEPGTWAFALAAFGFAGYVLRRARQPGLLQMA